MSQLSTDNPPLLHQKDQDTTSVSSLYCSSLTFLKCRMTSAKILCPCCFPRIDDGQGLALSSAVCVSLIPLYEWYMKSLAYIAPNRVTFRVPSCARVYKYTRQVSYQERIQASQYPCLSRPTSALRSGIREPRNASTTVRFIVLIE